MVSVNSSGFPEHIEPDPLNWRGTGMHVSSAFQQIPSRIIQPDILKMLAAGKRQVSKYLATSEQTDDSEIQRTASLPWYKNLKQETVEAMRALGITGLIELAILAAHKL